MTWEGMLPASRADPTAARPAARARGRLSFAASVGADVVSAAQVKRRHEAELLRIAGVRGVALGRDCVVVYVERDTAAIRTMVPRTLEGVPVEMVVSGPYRARP